MSGVRRSLDAAAAMLGSLVQRDVPLGPMTTYRVGGPAALFAALTTVEQLSTVADVVQTTGIEVLVVGRGSNILVADGGFDGLALAISSFADTIDFRHHTRPGDGEETVEDGTAVAGGGSGANAAVRLVTAGSAVLLPVLARRTAAASLTGMEWAVGVPGSVGGGIKMNAGGHGSDVAASLISADIVDLRCNRRGNVAAGDLGLRFRGSDIANHQVVLAGSFRLATGDRAQSEAELGEIVRWRREHQPGGQNAGSVFVNPVPGEVAAGELIDRLGLRGFRIGSAEVSSKHANFIQADDGGAAADVRALIDHVRSMVAVTFGFELRSEIRLVGFEDSTPSEPGVVVG